jgi:hypothetical protein
MKFNLDCFVLAQVRGDVDDDAPTVSIHGFFPTSAAALATLPELKKTLAAKWSTGINSLFGVREMWSESNYMIGKFYVFTLTEREFSSFFELEEAIETAAVAQWKNQLPPRPHLF